MGGIMPLLRGREAAGVGGFRYNGTCQILSPFLQLPHALSLLGLGDPLWIRMLTEV